ncbi:MAG: transposase [Sphingomonas sp.]|nr:transposase [Sphingomonas sp.]
MIRRACRRGCGAMPCSGSRCGACSTPTYASRKVWRQLRREGFDVAHCTVARLIRAMGGAAQGSSDAQHRWNGCGGLAIDQQQSSKETTASRLKQLNANGRMFSRLILEHGPSSCVLSGVPGWLELRAITEHGVLDHCEATGPRDSHFAHDRVPRRR